MSKQPRRPRRDTEEDIERLGQQVTQMLFQIRAIKLVLANLVADRMRDDDSIKASDEMIKNAILVFGSSNPAIQLSEEIASIAHEAARIASARKENQR